MTLQSVPFRLFALVVPLTPAFAATAAEVTVIRADDPAPDACLPSDCSLREAAAALATPEADVIQLQAGQYQLSIGPLPVSGEVSINGLGSDQTQLVGSINAALVQAGAFADVSVQGIALNNADDDAIAVLGSSALLLHDVTIPDDGGSISTNGVIAGTLDLRIEQSRIGRFNLVSCRQAQGRCRIMDSELDAGIRIQSDAATVGVIGSLIGPVSAEDAWLGIAMLGRAPLTVRDSVVRDTLYPLNLEQNDSATAANVTVTRTRFLGNRGPMRGNRASVISLADVEFRAHVTANSIGFSTLPAAAGRAGTAVGHPSRTDRRQPRRRQRWRGDPDHRRRFRSGLTRPIIAMLSVREAVGGIRRDALPPPGAHANVTANRSGGVTDITVLIGQARTGDRQARDRLFATLYGELKRVARRQLAGGDAPLHATSLVHEAYVKLARGTELAVNDREHFYAMAARIMRQIVIDRVRSRDAKRRGGDLRIDVLDTTALRVASDGDGVHHDDLLALDQALDRLTRLDPALAKLVELRFYAGLELEEISPLLDRSERSLKRDWRRARAFLHSEIGETVQADAGAMALPN